MKRTRLNGVDLDIPEPGDPGYADGRPVSPGKTAGLTMRVSTKAAVSVYGLQHWPVTLYAEQWLRLLAIADEIRDFIAENRPALSFKYTPPGQSG